jgi:solute carrier family 35 protein E3
MKTVNLTSSNEIPVVHLSNERVKQISYLAFNFFSTVAVTFINKLCFTKVQFGFPAALCNIHFVITWIGVEIMRRQKLFEPLDTSKSSKGPSLKDRNFLAIVLLLGTVTPMNNTSLKLNTVAFYQLFKLLVTPMVVALQYILDRKTLSRPRATFLIAVCTSVLLSTSFAAEFSVMGTICASIWVPLAAGFKVQWGRVQRQYNCSTLALMHIVYPYAIVVQLISGLFVDPAGVLSFQWTPEAIFWISMSGMAAFLVNVSGNLVIGDIGPLAHVLLGQLKTSVICLGAYYLFGSTLTLLQLMGALGAIFGIIGYTYVTTREKQKRDDGEMKLPLISSKGRKDVQIIRI